MGAEVLPQGGTHFRVWAPKRKRVAVVFEGGEQKTFELEREENGYFSALAESAGDGALYRFKLDDDDYLYPDPVSRFQPEGPHGPSRVVDPSKFRWTDGAWRGASIRGQVIYELHVGTFTREGTLEAARREVEELKRLGVTCVELMPVADFPGKFGWGYDGVNMFAPTRLYGDPEDLRRFVNEAHGVGLAVILDVVYNHLGPDGNYLRQFSDDYFSEKHKTEWGDALNFDGENAGPVREFFLSNGRYWVDEFHFDGLRLDATQSIRDDSDEHLLKVLGREVRDAARGRETIIVAENESQESRIARPVERGGYGLDGLWNDDFHHSAVVAMTGRNEAYYSDYKGRPQEFVSAVKYGYLFQGQRYKWQRDRRGAPSLDLSPQAFVTFIENHDQVSNSARGERLHKLTSPGRLRAMTTLVLLAPGTPMLFMGQEFASSSPFQYFADHEPDLAAKVRAGRADFLAQFRSAATKQMREHLPDPGDVATFERCKLDLSERDKNRDIYEMHRDLIRLRREDAVFSMQSPRGVDGAVLGDEAFVLRYFGEDGDDRLLLVNMGRDLSLDPAPEPLLAPPDGTVWTTLWSSEDYSYGGNGTPRLETKDNWRIPGHAAFAMRPVQAGTVRDLARGVGGPSEEEEVRRDALKELEEG